MILNVYWHVEGRVLGFLINGAFSFELLRQTDQITAEIIQRYGERIRLPIHIIRQYGADDLPEASIPIQQASQAIRQIERPSGIGYNITVTPNQNILMRFISTTAARIAGTQLRVAYTLGEAFDLLTRLDPTLPPQSGFVRSEENPVDLRQDVTALEHAVSSIS